MVSLKELQKKVPDDQVEFLNIPEGGSKQVQFLTEIHEFKYIVEHSSPKNWRVHGICTYDQGKCYGCEQQQREWNQKIRVFIPVLHEERMKVLSSGLGINSVVHPLSEYLREHSTILNTQFIITRNGKGKRTKYDAFPVADSPIMVYNGDTSLSELKKSMDYSKQAKHYK